MTHAAGSTPFVVMQEDCLVSHELRELTPVATQGKMNQKKTSQNSNFLGVEETFGDNLTRIHKSDYHHSQSQHRN